MKGHIRFWRGASFGLMVGFASTAVNDGRLGFAALAVLTAVFWARMEWADLPTERT